MTTNLPAPTIKKIIHGRAVEDNRHAPRCNKEKQADAEYQALKTAFLHIRHDHAFLAALRAPLRTLHQTSKHCSWELCAGELYYQLTSYADHPNDAPADYQPLLRLLPAYQQMAREAEADYNKFTVKYLGRHGQWSKNPDCWQQRVTELRTPVIAREQASGRLAL